MKRFYRVNNSNYAEFHLVPMHAQEMNLLFMKVDKLRSNFKFNCSLSNMSQKNTLW